MPIFETQMQLPDEGREHAEKQMSDLNLIPNVETFEISSTNNFEFDLNNTPSMENNSSSGIGLENLSDFKRSTGSQKNSTDNQRKAIYNMLLKKNVGGKLIKGTVSQIADEFAVHSRSITHIWKQGKSTSNVCHLMTANVGRKRCVVDLSNIPQIPLKHRTTLRFLGCAMCISHSRLFRAMKFGSIRWNTNTVEPFLTDDYKRARLEFCLSMLDESTIQHEPTFKDMYNVVHIDEKWFYMSKKSQRYYLLPEEEDSLRTCKSKKFIAKVMFLVVTGRPRFDSFRSETFSEKIGIFPFVVQVPAKRNSANRIAGTLETKSITSVTRDIMRSFMIEKVIPAIKDKWPRDDSAQPIFIKQDNARTHIDKNDLEFCEAAKQDGFDIRLMCQLPNSPDLNILNLRSRTVAIGNRPVPDWFYSGPHPILGRFRNRHSFSTF